VSVERIAGSGDVRWRIRKSLFSGLLFLWLGAAGGDSFLFANVSEQRNSFACGEQKEPTLGGDKMQGQGGRVTACERTNWWVVLTVGFDRLQFNPRLDGDGM